MPSGIANVLTSPPHGARFVRSTVHDAFFRGYEVIVPHDACAATSAREQVSSLYDIATHFGTVATTSEVTRAIATGGALMNTVFDP